MKKINFKQPKYILPAILFIPILWIGWNVADVFSSNKLDTDTSVVKKGELNTDLPNPNMENKNMEMKSKYQNMMDDFGKIKDYAAVQGIEDDSHEMFDELGNSIYSDEEIAMLDSLEQQKQARLKDLNAMQLDIIDGRNNGNNEYNNTPASQPQQKDELTEQLALLQKIASGGIDEEKESVPAPKQQDVQKEEKIIAEEVHKANKINTTYFNTVQKGKENSNKFIKAILDETLKATDGSRLRIRLLDDIEVDGNVLPKGAYLYAIVSGFEAQRIKAEITSILIDNTHLNVSLSIYDNDGIEGFYVPASAFREFQKEVGSQALNQNLNMNQNTGEQSVESMAFQTLQSVYQSTTSAVSNNIRKNKAKLKYNTVVYLINKNK